jgi:hypothetical protein
MDSTYFVSQKEDLRDSPMLPERPAEPAAPYDIPLHDDDSPWDVFIPDDDEIDPLPEPGDFWIEPDE